MPRLTARWALVALVVASSVFTLWVGHGTNFRADEWSYLFLSPSVGHLVPLQILGYHGLAMLAGLDSYWAFRLAAVAMHVACCVLLFIYLRRRWTERGAVLATVPILFLGTGGEAFVTAHQSAPLAALGAGIAALLCLDRRDRKGDMGAALLLVLAIACDAEGLVVAGAVAVEIVLTPGARRRIWVALVPLAVFAAWALTYLPGHLNDGVPPGSGVGPAAAATYLWHLATSAVAGLAGLQLSSQTLQRHAPWLDELANAVVLVGALLLAVRLRRRLRQPRVAMLIVAALGFWALIALARSSLASPYTARYVFVGALLLVMLAAELGAGVRLARRGRRLLVAAVALATALNAGWMVVLGRFLREDSQIVSAQIGALEIARGRVPPQFSLGPAIRARDVSAGLLFAATRRYDSSPAPSPAGIAQLPQPARAAADAVLVRALPVTFVAAGHAPSTLGCRRVASGATATTLPGGSLVARRLRGPTGALVRRFGPAPGLALPPVTGRAAVLTAPLGRAETPWRARLTGVTDTFACPEGGGPR